MRERVCVYRGGLTGGEMYVYGWMSGWRTCMKGNEDIFFAVQAAMYVCCLDDWQANDV